MNTTYICTKGRAGKSKTIENLLLEKVMFFIVCEPQDQERYGSAYGVNLLLVMPENNKGIAYARNFCLKHAQQMQLKHIWILDDDITALYVREGTKLIRQAYKQILDAAEAVITAGSYAVGGLEYRQFAWSASREIIENTFTDCCVLIDVEWVKQKGITYREQLPLKSDRDFNMQCIKAGGKTCRVTTHALSAPKNGSNAGGLKEIAYDAGVEKASSELMVSLWGNEICQLFIKPDGRPDVKINWKNINSTQGSLF